MRSAHHSVLASQVFLYGLIHSGATLHLWVVHLYKNEAQDVSCFGFFSLILFFGLFVCSWKNHSSAVGGIGGRLLGVGSHWTSFNISG